MFDLNAYIHVLLMTNLSMSRTMDWESVPKEQKLKSGK